MKGQHLIDLERSKAIFNLNGELILAYKLEEFKSGEITDVTLIPFITTKISEEVFFNENSNKSKRILIDNINEASYQVYGEIINLNPLVLDVGSIEIEIDKEDLNSEIAYNTISLGEFVYMYIDRLDIEKY